MDIPWKDRGTAAVGYLVPIIMPIPGLILLVLYIYWRVIQKESAYAAEHTREHLNFQFTLQLFTFLLLGINAFLLWGPALPDFGIPAWSAYLTLFAGFGFWVLGGAAVLIAYVFMLIGLIASLSGSAWTPPSLQLFADVEKGPLPERLTAAAAWLLPMLVPVPLLSLGLVYAGSLVVPPAMPEGKAAWRSAVRFQLITQLMLVSLLTAMLVMMQLVDPAAFFPSVITLILVLLLALGMTTWYVLMGTALLGAAFGSRVQLPFTKNRKEEDAHVADY
ncbi:DUF4870 domain-containing protein [Alkalicoccus chagannorensis]|uniref:DUF4870 domain-containing protein n=1 Tax=Alkalicoccus chagannorensis TaxID=427072 RepID=UPI00040F45B5|nr:DUF4870 domain-containing protein [Alkalicoccus chagannorensis]